MIGADSLAFTASLPSSPAFTSPCTAAPSKWLKRSDEVIDVECELLTYILACTDRYARQFGRFDGLIERLGTATVHEAVAMHPIIVSAFSQK